MMMTSKHLVQEWVESEPESSGFKISKAGLRAVYHWFPSAYYSPLPLGPSLVVRDGPFLRPASGCGLLHPLVLRDHGGSSQ